MRLLMLGTGPFAVPTFRALLDSSHEVAALVTRPPRPARGTGPVPENPMRRVAQERGLPIHDPEGINEPGAIALLRNYHADLFVVCDYGQILSPEALASARLGGINLHASLLPKYRGAAPINWAIYHGEEETGVTVIHMTPALDAGPCLMQVRTPIGAEETAADVEARLAELGVPAVLDAIAALAGDRPLDGIPQDRAQATKAPRLKKTDGLVDWTRSAQQICNQVRAFQPWPKTYTFWQRPGVEPMRLILDKVAATTQPAMVKIVPGTVMPSQGRELVVACGGDRGAVAILQLQPAGKRVLTAKEFLAGNHLALWNRLGGDAADPAAH